jgi:hypothetical protein
MSSTATTSSSNRHGTDVIAAALVQHELAVRSCHGIEVPVPDHALPQAVELRDQVAAALAQDEEPGCAARECARLHLTQCRMWVRRRPSRKRHDAPLLRSALDPGRQRSEVRVPVYGRRSVARFLLGLDGCNGVSRLLLRLREFPDLAL